MAGDGFSFAQATIRKKTVHSLGNCKQVHNIRENLRR